MKGHFKGRIEEDSVLKFTFTLLQKSHEISNSSFVPYASQSTMGTEKPTGPQFKAVSLREVSLGKGVMNGAQGMWAAGSMPFDRVSSGPNRLRTVSENSTTSEQSSNLSRAAHSNKSKVQNFIQASWPLFGRRRRRRTYIPRAS